MSIYEYMSMYEYISDTGSGMKGPICCSAKKVLNSDIPV